MDATATLTIDLDALARNFRTLQRITGVPVQPVVKADAYGLGAVACTRRLLSQGADTVFVARAAEGVALRQAIGPAPTIHVLDGCLSGTAATLRDAGLSPILNGPAQLADWHQASGGPCGLQIDTGMNRLGFRPDDAPPPFEGLTLVLSHLACADDPTAEMNRRQRDAFATVAARYPGQTRSFANSGGCFLGPDYGFDAVRPGICLYGGGPEGRPDARIAPVATLRASILQLRDVAPGESVGYSRGFVADRPMRIATLGAGYADGVLRANAPRGQAFIAGTLRPLLGRISMDVCAVDATDLAVTEGDSVELFGPNLPIDTAATTAGTLAYELLTSIAPRVRRVYVSA